MLIDLSQELSLSADSGATDVTTAPVRFPPGLSRLQLTMLTHRAYATNGFFTVVVRVQGSNDTETWYAVADIDDISVATESNAETSGEFLFAYIRLEISLTTPVGDQAYWAGRVDGEGKTG